MRPAFGLLGEKLQLMWRDETNTNAAGMLWECRWNAVGVLQESIPKQCQKATKGKQNEAKTGAKKGKRSQKEAKSVLLQLLGHLGTLLGESWGHWGASRVVLEPITNITKTTFQKDQLPDPKTQTYRTQMGALGRLKSDQNENQNESKFGTFFKSEKVALQDLLGGFLSRS